MGRISKRVKRVDHQDGSSTSVQRKTKLQFKNGISPTILTGEEIKGADNTHIELNLVDDSTGEIVDVGPESSANVEIVLFNGGSAASETDFLSGDVNITLEKGVVILNNIKLKHRASETKPPVFTLGARVAENFNGVDIREGKTESFTVEIYRKKYFKKHEIPSLSDEVYRLNNIYKYRAVHRRLKKNFINTVEDFLVQLMIDPRGLRKLMNLGHTKFAATVEHARRARQIGQKMFCYMDSEKTKVVVFNILGTILGLYHNNHYARANSFSENLKVVAEGLFKSALGNWKDTVSLNDDNALDTYFASLIMPSLDPLPKQSCNDNISTCETIGESSNTQTGNPLQNFDSSMNYPHQEAFATELEDDHSFCVDDVEMDCDPPSQRSPRDHFHIERKLREFEEFFRQRSWKRLSSAFKFLRIGKKKRRNVNVIKV